MSEELRELSRLLVRCKNWRWLPGMKDLEGWRLYRELPLGGWDAIGGEWEYHQVAHYPKLPDLTDPATLGCLLALVRDAWGDPYLCCVGDRETGWRLDGYAAVEDIHSYSSEAEALFVALRAAP